MEKYHFSKDEQETILIYNRADDCWVCSTNVPMHIAKLERQGWELTQDLGYERGYKAPKNAIKFKNLNVKKRQLTDEQKASLLSRLKKES